MNTRTKIAIAGAALVASVVWLGVRLDVVSFGGSARPDGQGGAASATSGSIGGRVAGGAPKSLEEAPESLANLKPGEISYTDREGRSVVLARPPVSKARAREAGLPAETSVATAMIEYLLHGPLVHGYTQEDAEWFLALLREHEDSETKKIGLWGMGFALSRDQPEVPRTYSDATRDEMERAILDSLRSRDAVLRRSAAAQVFIAGLELRPEYDARLKELTHDPDPDVAYWVSRRMERAEKDRAR